VTACLLCLAVRASHAPTCNSGVGAECIGDGRTSPASSREFFRDLDTDSDGVVEKHEMLEHLKHFGGKSLDEPEEIRRSMEYAFRRVDTNKDGELDVAESHFFWRQLGSLLSVDEVAEWVVHGLQLPAEVGEAFRANSVDAYEFPELVKDDGEALETQVGITRLSQRRKLVRYMRMVLSGVAVLPEIPQMFLVDPIGCSGSHLRWVKPNGRGWDPHTYRVFRRQVEPPSARAPGVLGFTTLPSFSISGSPVSLAVQQPLPSGLANSNSVMPRTLPFGKQAQVAGKRKSTWELVYEGPATEAVDEAMVPGSSYEYRIEAWNVFGRSEARQPFLAGDLQLSCSPASHYFSLVYRIVYLLLTVFPMALSMIAVLFRSARLYSGKKRRSQGHDEWIWQATRIACNIPIIGHYVDHFLPDPVFGRSVDHGPRPDGTVSPRAVGTQQVNDTGTARLAVLPETLGSQRRNHTKCYRCDVPFLRWKRSRHHCCICGKSFCAKHGVVTHAWLRTCPVGGKCTCDQCAETFSAAAKLPAPPTPPLSMTRYSSSLSSLSSESSYSSSATTGSLSTTRSCPPTSHRSMASLPSSSRPPPLAPALPLDDHSGGEAPTGPRPGRLNVYRRSVSDTDIPFYRLFGRKQKKELR